MAVSFGSVDRPARLDAFTRIIEVGWSTGRVAVLTLKYARFNFFEVLGVVPEDSTLTKENWSAPQLFKDDYKEKSILQMPNSSDLEEIEWMDDLESIVYDGYSGSSYAYSDNPQIREIGLQQDQEYIASRGREPDVRIKGGTHKDNFVTHTHPNGLKTTYLAGFEYPILFTPPDFDWTRWDEMIWFHKFTIDGQKQNVVRKSWFINFGKNANDQFGVSVAKLSQVVQQSVAYVNEYELTIYPYGTEFQVKEDGTMSPTTETAKVFFSEKRNWPSSFVGDVEFSRGGFISPSFGG